MQSSRLRLNVLIIAHEFSPTQGSECAVGWNIVTRIANYHDVTVLYASGSQQKRDSYVQSVNNYIAENGSVPGLTFINIDQPPITKFLASLNKSFANLGATGLPMLYYLGYKYWQKSALSKAKKLHQQRRFDLVHQLTQIAFREPGYWWRLGIPFFWGPTGGLRPLPKQFYKLYSLKGRLLETIRKFSNYYQFNFSYKVIKANKRASVIYTYSTEDADLFKRRAFGKIKLMLDVGTLNHQDKFSHKKIGELPVKGIWCGHLIERKAAIILLKALALSKLTKEEVQFQIIGGGPLEEMLHKQSESLGLNNIEWIKNVDHNTVFKLMSEADFFVHTSIREATSSVIPEALSTGLPVICHDANGMSIAVNDSCGIKIPMESPEASIRYFHSAIERLVLNKQLINELAIGANNRSREISWDSMAETIANDYTDIANGRSGKQ